MKDFLAVTQTLTVAGIGLSECPICSSMVLGERLPRHVEVLHDGWIYESSGAGLSTLMRKDDA